jgi:hypothetical protein
MPPGFDFMASVKSHYKSEEEFFGFFLKAKDTDSIYGLALNNLMLGVLKKDPLFIRNSKVLFSLSCSSAEDAREKELSLAGVGYANNLLTEGFKAGTEEKVILDPIVVRKQKNEFRNVGKVVIGKSVIRIRNGARIKTQVDRVSRDWLSAYNIDRLPWQFDKEKIVPWHEGEKIKEILNFVDARVTTVWGTKVKKIGEGWYGPDAEGIYRFRISEDKVYGYPTNIITDPDSVFIHDTHGINAIAWDSLDADLVLGCGDLDGKVQAAYYLAGKGVNVYMPTDRFVSQLIGTRTRGTIIGSAPIRKTQDGAVIGDQPITIDINEPILVTNAEGGYPMQYYDTPYRYFRELEKYLGIPMKITPVQVDEYGRADKIVEAAEKDRVGVIGIRVASKEEYESVARWLRADRSRRAILFHSAVYPDGYRLFYEFPSQTTFGDINIYFR